MNFWLRDYRYNENLNNTQEIYEQGREITYNSSTGVLTFPRCLDYVSKQDGRKSLVWFIVSLYAIFQYPL